MEVVRPQQPRWEIIPKMRCAPSIIFRFRTKIQSARVLIGTHFLAAQRKLSVSTRFENVNFPRSWPRPVGVRRRNHPQCRPEPIAGRQFGSNLNICVFEVKLTVSLDASRPNRWSWIVFRAIELTNSGLANTKRARGDHKD